MMTYWWLAKNQVPEKGNLQPDYNYGIIKNKLIIRDYYHLRSIKLL